MELGGGHVQSQRDLVARPVSRLFDGGDQQLQSFPAAGQVGREPSLVAHVGAQSPIRQDLLELLVDLHPGPESGGERGQAGRHHHEFLDIQRVGGVGPSVEHVEQGNGQILG